MRTTVNENAGNDVEDDDLIFEDPNNADHILVPNLQKMEDRILTRCKQVMAAGLNESLKSRQLWGIVEEVIVTEAFRVSDIHIQSGDAISFYRRNRTEMAADILFWANVTIMTDDGKEDIPVDLGMTLLFRFGAEGEGFGFAGFGTDSSETDREGNPTNDFDENDQIDPAPDCDGNHLTVFLPGRPQAGGFVCEFDSLWDITNAPDREGMVRLDSFLCPYIPRGEKEQFADWLWQLYGLDGIHKEECRHPVLLAEKMGLSVVTAYVEAKWSCIICLQEMRYMVYSNEEEANRKIGKYPEIFAPGTMIINRASKWNGPGFLEIYNHCIRYEWYFMFFCLQDASSDIAEDIPLKSIPREEKRPNLRPIHWMRQMSNRLAHSLLLPHDFMLEFINRNREEASSIKRFHNYRNHTASMLQELAKLLYGDHYELRSGWIKTRFLQMQYPQARGILNATDGHHIDAYETMSDLFDGGDYTLAIGYRARVLTMFTRNQLFREVMESGDWTFADGLIVRDHPDYLMQTSQGPRITSFGNRAADVCCLRFTQKWSPRIRRYVYSFEKSDYEWMKDGWKSFDDSEYARQMGESRAAQIRHMEEKSTFGELLTELMRTRCTEAELDGKVRMKYGTVGSYMQKDHSFFFVDDVVQLCIALHLKPWQSRILFEKAGLSYVCENAAPDPFYRWAMVCCFYQEEPETLSKYLEDVKLNYNSIPLFGEWGKEIESHAG